MMKEFQIVGTTELSRDELIETNGGLFLELLIACVAFGYMVGKDAAERERRLQP
ncbi:MAG: hypothetical protein ACK5L7_03560 [Paludibacteraceae bacterium]